MVQSFGGPWTQEKLKILEGYLDTYTTVLKDQPFHLIYVDAFAGEGAWRPGHTYAAEDYGDYREMVEGSARIALRIQDRQFDKLIFIEKDPNRCASLGELKTEHSARDITILNEDANTALPSVCSNLAWNDRLVVFLDPFATSVQWATIEVLARTKKVDCWILFPLNAIARMLPTDGTPPAEWQDRLDRIFGGREHWQSMYRPSPQLNFWEEQKQERDVGGEAIANCYRERLESTFARIAPTRRILRNSKNAPLFELFFGASNPAGAARAIPIADHLLKYW